MNNLIPQIPAEGIMKTNDFGDSACYTVSCQCGNTDDEIRFEVEADDHSVTVHHWVKVKTVWWDEPTRYRWINGLIRRLKITYKLWIHGYVEYESWTMLNQQQAINYSNVLKKASLDVVQYREKNKLQP